jgi:putative hydrolase of the HAD superfamily
MTIRAVVFDIGGVLEITPSLGVDEAWEQKLGLKPGELNVKLASVWKGGSLGTMSLTEVHQNIGAILKLSEADVDAYMAEI